MLRIGKLSRRNASGVQPDHPSAAPLLAVLGRATEPSHKRTSSGDNEKYLAAATVTRMRPSQQCKNRGARGQTGTLQMPADSPKPPDGPLAAVCLAAVLEDLGAIPYRTRFRAEMIAVPVMV